MKKHEKSTAPKLIEKYDQQLRDILTEELKMVKSAKNQFIRHLSVVMINDNLFVA